MKTVDKEALKKSRKTALILGLATVFVMLIILYIIQKTIRDPNEQVVALGFSTLVLVIIIIIIGLYRKKKISRSKTIQTVILLALSGIFFRCSDQSAKNTDDTQQLQILERQWLEKEFALDTAFLSSIMDSTFISISEEGIKDKQADLLSMYSTIDARIKKGIVIDSFRLENEVVNLYSNTAVVTFIVHTYRHQDDSLIERRTRFYDVWIKRGDNWKAVSSQGTGVQP